MRPRVGVLREAILPLLLHNHGPTRVRRWPKGRPINIVASGLINYSGGDPSTIVTPAGIGGTIHDPKTIAPNLPSTALIAKIVPGGVPFFIGAAKSFVAPVSGELFLGVNDENNAFEDNSGGWVASISQAGGGDASGERRSVGTAPLTPEVKQMIADRSAAPGRRGNSGRRRRTAQGQDIDFGLSGIEGVLSDNQPHVFVVGAISTWWPLPAKYAP